MKGIKADWKFLFEQLEEWSCSSGKTLEGSGQGGKGWSPVLNMFSLKCLLAIQVEMSIRQLDI